MVVFETFREYLNEDFIGFTQDQANNTIEIYKNPKSIKKFESNTRAIIGLKGDLYVIDNADDFLHHQLKDYLFKIHPKEGVVPQKYNEQLHLVRYGKTDSFYLSELYDKYDLEKYKNQYIEIFTKCKENNPKITFILGLSNFYNKPDSEIIKI
jgi:hypothetical protein